jgi:hypothetical protein
MNIKSSGGDGLTGVVVVKAADCTSSVKEMLAGIQRSITMMKMAESSCSR